MAYTWWIWAYVLLAALVAALAVLATVVWLRYIRLRQHFPRPEHRPLHNRPSIEHWEQDGCYVTWIGHSTLYFHLFGTRILTDPVLSDKVGVSIGPVCIGPKRYTDPALSLGDLIGRVDIILLSHAHLDHLDLPSLRRLANPRTHVVTAAGTARLLQGLPFGSVTELGGTGRVSLPGGVTVQAVPVRHWGARFPWNRGYGWTGYLVEVVAQDGRHVRILFAGDTAYTPNFIRLREGGPLDIACMPIGAYAPDAFQRAHCTPEQAWQMFVDSGARWFVPMHWNTFVLSQEPVDEPLTRLLTAAGDDADRVVIRAQGETFRLPEEESHARTENG